jgi:hypothetical protein
MTVPMESKSLSQAPSTRAAHPVPVRALAIGTATVALLSFLCPYLGAVSETWDPGGSALPVTAVVALFALVAVNSACRRFLPRWALTRVELLFVYGMMIMVVQLPYKGSIPFIMGATAWPFYGATAANNWEHRIWPYLPVAFQLSDPRAAVWYFEGSPPGVGVPWADWASPVLVWSAFLIAVSAAMFCLGSLLSRDWIERQRLAYPLAEIPLAMVGGEDTPTLGNALRDKVLWIGFSIPAVFAVLFWLHKLYPSVPALDVFDLDVGRAFRGMSLPWSVLGGSSGMRMSLAFPLIGIAYLLPGEISLSLWLFYVLFRVQQLAWASFGVAEGGSGGAVIDPVTFIGMEEAGGFIALCAVILYQSRHTLRAAWRELISRAPLQPDPYTPLAGRWALLGFIVSNLFLLVWAWRVGTPQWPFMLIMALFYIVTIGVSRLVAAAGVTHVDTGFTPRQLVLRTIGTGPVGPISLSVFGFLDAAVMHDPRIVLMAQAMTGLRLLHSGRAETRRFSWGALLAILVTLAVAFPTMLWICSRHGAATLPAWPMVTPPQGTLSALDSSLRSPQLPDNWLRAAVAIGAAIMLGLIAMHSRFLWWPVSPVGFVIGSAWATDYWIWFNTLIGWLISTNVRRYGGLKLYRALRPAFIGLVIGGYVPEGILAAVSSLLGYHFRGNI